MIGALAIGVWVGRALERIVLVCRVLGVIVLVETKPEGILLLSSVSCEVIVVN